MRNASLASSASSQSVLRASWPRVMTSTVPRAMTRSLPRNAFTASRYKDWLEHRVFVCIKKSSLLWIYRICKYSNCFTWMTSSCFSAPLRPSPLEESAIRTSPGTPNVSSATPAVNLWQELASLPTRTTFTVWTATRLMWPRSATAARIPSQVSAASANAVLLCDSCCRHTHTVFCCWLTVTVLSPQGLATAPT